MQRITVKLWYLIVLLHLMRVQLSRLDPTTDTRTITDTVFKVRQVPIVGFRRMEPMSKAPSVLQPLTVVSEEGALPIHIRLRTRIPSIQTDFLLGRMLLEK